MDRSFPSITYGRFARFSISFVVWIWGLSCLSAIAGGLWLIYQLASDGRYLLVLFTAVGIAAQFAFAYGMVLVTTTARTVLEWSSGRDTTGKVAVHCENGHKFHASRSQAGSQVACPHCGVEVVVPPLSQLD